MNNKKPKIKMKQFLTKDINPGDEIIIKNINYLVIMTYFHNKMDKYPNSISIVSSSEYESILTQERVDEYSTRKLSEFLFIGNLSEYFGKRYSWRGNSKGFFIKSG